MSERLFVPVNDSQLDIRHAAEARLTTHTTLQDSITSHHSKNTSPSLWPCIICFTINYMFRVRDRSSGMACCCCGCLHHAQSVQKSFSVRFHFHRPNLLGLLWKDAFLMQRQLKEQEDLQDYVYPSQPRFQQRSHKGDSHSFFSTKLFRFIVFEIGLHDFWGRRGILNAIRKHNLAILEC